MSLSRYLSVLFDPGEQVCSSGTIFGNKAVNLHEVDPSQHQFITVNPIKEKRRDLNVTAFRNVLVEFDSLPLAEQHDRVEERRMPFSTCVFSGGKSSHFIVSLESPLPDQAAYREMASRIYRAVGGKPDKKCKNPSRFTRLPFHFRRDMSAEQRLEYVGERIPNSEVEAWLLSRGVGPQIKPAQLGAAASVCRQTAGIRPATLNLVYCGAFPGERNDRLFKAACDLREHGYTKESATDFLLPALDRLGPDFTVEEFSSVIASAFRYR